MTEKLPAREGHFTSSAECSWEVGRGCDLPGARVALVEAGDFFPLPVSAPAFALSETRFAAWRSVSSDGKSSSVSEEYEVTMEPEESCEERRRGGFVVVVVETVARNNALQKSVAPSGDVLQLHRAALEARYNVTSNHLDPRRSWRSENSLNGVSSADTGGTPCWPCGRAIGYVTCQGARAGGCVSSPRPSRSSTSVSPLQPASPASPPRPTPTMVATQAAGDPAPQDDRNTKLVDEITRSDIGVSTLLTRLKQSVSSAQDCAAFFKKRATQEEKNAQEIRKLCRSTLESLRRPDSRQGSYAQQFEELTRIHDRLAENGLQYAAALHQMYDDLTKLTGSMDHGRKQWKLFGLSSEKKVHDADVLVDKAKARLDALADGSAGGRPGRLGFMAAAKSGLSRRDDDMTPMEAATEDYQHKQQNARALRQELMQTQRPQAVNALKDMISECDAGLAALLQKYGRFSELGFLRAWVLILPQPNLQRS